MDVQYPKSVIGGLACRMPKSRNSEEFWDNLINGKDMIDSTHWPQGLYDLPPRIGALLDLQNFDNAYFEIPEEEADKMNPMLWHLLEVTYECIVDSGRTLTDLQAAKTGIYLACFGSDTDFTETSRDFNNHVTTSPYLVSGIAKAFGLTGPAITADTACSSSIATFNMAVNDLMAGKCTYAIVAACNLVINPLFSQQMFVLGMLSKNGVSSVFDEAANGYVRAEGCAVLLLARDADCFPRVYCNVVDVGVGCDGYKNAGITNPNPETQAALMKELYERSSIDVKDIYYVELHGTGTQVGDKAETAGVTEVFCKNRDEPLLIGSVKSNMGHSEATSALAAIIKVIMMMHFKEIPANLNYKNPNPEISGIHSNKLKVVDKPTPLKGKHVGISSFGFGGVNGHVILEPYIESNKDEFEHVSGHVMIPITTRNFDCVHKIVEFINNNRYNSVLLGMLSESQLSCDERQPIRGYIQIGPGEDDFHVNCDTRECDIPKVCLCLEDFMGSYICVHKDLLEINSFIVSLTACSQSIRKMDPTLDIVTLLKTGEVFVSHTRLGMLIATAILISMHTLLEEALLGYNKIIGCGLSELVGAYLDGCLTLDQCFNVVNCIGKHVEEFSKTSGDRWAIYDVHMDFELLYQLGPGTQVLSINTPHTATVAIETKYKDKVLQNKIHNAGGFYNALASNVPMYSLHMKETSEKIKKELRDIIPSPVYRSSRLVTAQTGWKCCVESENTNVLINANYIGNILCKPVNLESKLLHKPEDSLFLRMLSTSLPPPHLRRTMADLDASHMTDNSYQSSMTPKSGRRYQYGKSSGLSCQDDESEPEASYSLEEEYEDIPFVATAESLCHTLGELHMNGYQLDVGILFPKPIGPLGISCPSLGPLVGWDHSVNWTLPHWLAFSSRVKDEVTDYEIILDNDEKLNTPIAVALYHAWQAINEMLEDQMKPDDALKAIKMTGLHVPNEALLTPSALDGAIVHVHLLTQKFAVVENDVLLEGHFEVKDSFLLPSVPGYDLDINDNVQFSPKDSEPLCDKTEIEWEDSWLDFLSDIIEFSTNSTESPIKELIIDPAYHLREAKECSNFLAVAEKYTGMCRSGGVALSHKLLPNEESSDFNLSQIPVSNPSKTLVSKVLVYSLYSNQTTTDRIVLYEADKQTDTDGGQVVGIMNMNGDKLISEIAVPSDWVPEDLEALVPYMLASYILYEVAQIRNEQTVLIMPPIDTVGQYMISLAAQLGCSVFASTYDIEHLQSLESTFPNIRVIPGNQLEESLMYLTQGQGVDVCIRLSGGEIGSPMQLISKNGEYIQCVPPPHVAAVSHSVFTESKTVSILRPLDSVAGFMSKSQDNLQALLFNLKDDAINKLSKEGFPESKGVLYSQENSSSFSQPIALDKLLSLVMEPNLGTVNEDLSKADVVHIEKIQGLVAPKPKDYSLADTSCLQKNTFEDESQGPLNTGMMHTPLSQNKQQVNLSNFSPEVNLINLQDPVSNQKGSSPVLTKKTIKNPDQDFQTTSTPLNQDQTTGAVKKSDPLEESYLDISKIKKEPERQPVPPPIPKIIVEVMADSPSRRVFKSPSLARTESLHNVLSGNKPKGLKEKVGTPARITPSGSFRQQMKDKSKEVPPKLNLLKPKFDLIICSPLTPMTPALKSVLTPQYVSNLVPLNPLKVGKEAPLFIVHPVTGMTKLLEAFGGELKLPCFGIQRTHNTPADSISSVASFYINSIQTVQPYGPYRISGYSFGTMIALEIAKQLQAQEQKVEQLIFLDGSPLYIHSQIAFAMKHLPEHATSKQIEEALEAGALLNWMSFYGPVVDREMKFGLLRKLPTLEDKLNTAVSMTFGEVKVSKSPQATKWFAIKEKILKDAHQKKDQFADAAKELIRCKRRERAEDFVTHVKMARLYKCPDKFVGDIHLHRIKADPVFQSYDLPTDYGLQTQCTGKVHIKFYNGDHESFLTKDSLAPLVKDVPKTLDVECVMAAKEEDAFTCWICKGDGHKAGSRACPMFLTETVKRERLRWSFEDPMHNFIKEEEKKDKEKRIQELQSLLDTSSSSSSSSEDDDRNRDHRKRKKKKKHKKAKKHKGDGEKHDTKDLNVKEDKSKDYVKSARTSSDSNRHRKSRHKHHKYEKYDKERDKHKYEKECNKHRKK